MELPGRRRPSCDPAQLLLTSKDPLDRREMWLMAQSLYAPQTTLRIGNSGAAVDVVLIGLYVRSQRLLRSLAFLDELEMEDCCDPILRSLFDLAGTFIWLSNDDTDEERLAWFVSSHHRDARLLAETGLDVFNSLLGQAEELVNLLGESAEGSRKLPPIEQRFGNHPLATHYSRYRDLSRRSHASMSAAVMYLEPGEPGVLEVSFERERRFAKHFLAYGAMLVLFLSLELIDRGYVDPPGDVEVLGSTLWHYWRAVEGKDPWPI